MLNDGESDSDSGEEKRDGFAQRLAQQAKDKSRELWQQASDCPWRWQSYVKLTGGLVGAALLIWAAVWFSQADNRDAFRDWIGRLGYWGNLLFLLIFVLTNLPVGFGFMAMEIMCGLLYPLPLALATVIVGTSLGITVCYLLTRLLLKDWFDGLIRNNPKLQVVVYAAQTNALKIAFLIHFAPLPMGVQTGILAMAEIPLYIVLPTGFLAFLPENAVMVYTAWKTAGVHDPDDSSTDPLHIVFYVFSGVLLVVATLYLGWMTKQALQQAELDMQRRNDDNDDEDPTALLGTQVDIIDEQEQEQEQIDDADQQDDSDMIDS